MGQFEAMGLCSTQQVPTKAHTPGVRRIWWLVLLWCCVLAWLPVTAQSADPRPSAPQARDDSPAVKEFLATSLPPNNPGNFAWPHAAQVLGREADAIYLRLGLADLWLQTLEAAAPPASMSIAQAVANGRAVHPRDLEERAAVQWRTRIAPAWKPVWDPEGNPVPLPAEIDAMAGELKEEGPGLWAHLARDTSVRGLYWWLGMRHTLNQPLPLSDFTLQVSAPMNTVFLCTLPRYATVAAVPPGATHFFLCRTQTAPATKPPAGTSWGPSLSQSLERGFTLTVALPLGDQSLSQTARALGSLPSPQVDDFIRRTRDCAARSTCSPGSNTGTITGGKDANPRGHATPPAAQIPAKSSPLIGRLITAGTILGTLLIYGLIAHFFSTVLASVLLWVGLAIPCGLFVQQLWSTNWADSWGGLMVIPASLAAMAAPFVGTAIAYGVYRLLVSEEARRTALAGAGVVLTVILLNLLQHWLF